MIRSLSLLSFLFFFLTLFLLCVLANPVIAQPPSSRSGVVTETMDASGYSYLQIDTGGEKLWVAIPETKLKVGEKVTFREGMIMENFTSKTLGKTFDSIVFSSGLEGQKLASPHTTPTTATAKKGGGNSFADAVKVESGREKTAATPAQISGGSTGAMVPFMETEVEKAPGENSYSVEEIFSGAENLNGKRVLVRGKVVKFSPNIMGKNWIHLQDGSGDPMKNTHDLVVTTAAQAKIDVIITVEGKVAAKKDFGFGYKYEALLEEAEITE